MPKVDHVPSGQLSLVITNVRHTRQRWTERQKPLQEMCGPRRLPRLEANRD